MDQRQINRLEMYKAVQNYLDSATSIWSAIPVVVTLKNEFDEQLSAIETGAKQQENARIFLGKNKTTQKRYVADKADILNDALEAYASINNNAELEQKAAKTFSDLYRLRNQDFETVIKETITLLAEHLPQLADYGVTQGQLADLQNSMDTYLTLTGKPRQYRIAEKQATTDLSELFTQTSDLLTKKIDKVMTRFKRTNTNFYNGYLAARTIVDN